LKVVVSDSIGFCHGVRRAVEKAKQCLASCNNVHISGDLVHNRSVCEELEKAGLIVHPDGEIPGSETENSVILIRAHGTDPTTEDELKKKFLRVLDLTCPIVRSVFEQAESLDRENYHIVVLGKKHHPETRALTRRLKEPHVIEDDKDLDHVICLLSSAEGKTALISQTTMSSEKYHNTLAKLRENMGDRVYGFNTICRETLERECEARRLASETDLVVVIGASSSSNTRKLVSTVETAGTAAILVEEVRDLHSVTLPNTVGIISGTSTPMKQVQQILDNIEWAPRR